MKNRIISMLLAVVTLLGIIPTATVSVAGTENDDTFRDLTAFELVEEIGVGWNLGNTLDAHNGTKEFDAESMYEVEELWIGEGNRTTPALIKAVKAAGFNTVRIPTTWYKMTGDAPDYIVDSRWLAHVKSIVDMVIDEDLFCIINIHHDERIIRFNNAENMLQGEQALRALWTQIADTFKDYDERLVFEGLNEPRTVGSSAEWSGGTAVERQNLNILNQAFVEVVRASGGNNPLRVLVVPTYAASADSRALNGFTVPNDTVADKIILAAHTYSPFNWAHNGNGTYDGIPSIAVDINRVADRAEELGIPVILGEWGSIASSSPYSAREQHAEDYVTAAAQRGIKTIWWDDSGNFRLIGRAENADVRYIFPEIIEGIMRGIGKEINIERPPASETVQLVLRDSSHTHRRGPSVEITEDGTYSLTIEAEGATSLYNLAIRTTGATFNYPGGFAGLSKTPRSWENALITYGKITINGAEHDNSFNIGFLVADDEVDGGYANAELWNAYYTPNNCILGVDTLGSKAMALTSREGIQTITVEFTVSNLGGGEPKWCNYCSGLGCSGAMGECPQYRCSWCYDGECDGKVEICPEYFCRVCRYDDCPGCCLRCGSIDCPGGMDCPEYRCIDCGSRDCDGGMDCPEYLCGRCGSSDCPGDCCYSCGSRDCDGCCYYCKNPECYEGYNCPEYLCRRCGETDCFDDCCYDCHSRECDGGTDCPEYSCPNCGSKDCPEDCCSYCHSRECDGGTDCPEYYCYNCGRRSCLGDCCRRCDRKVCPGEMECPQYRCERCWQNTCPGGCCFWCGSIDCPGTKEECSEYSCRYCDSKDCFKGHCIRCGSQDCFDYKNCPDYKCIWCDESDCSSYMDCPNYECILCGDSDCPMTPGVCPNYYCQWCGTEDCYGLAFCSHCGIRIYACRGWSEECNKCEFCCECCPECGEIGDDCVCCPDCKKAECICCPECGEIGDDCVCLPCGDCGECGCNYCFPETDGKCGECQSCKAVTEFTLGDITGDGKVLINDAVEILCYLAKLSSPLSVGKPNQALAWKASLITPASKEKNIPQIQDAVEILCYLAELNSLLKTP